MRQKLQFLKVSSAILLGACICFGQEDSSLSAPPKDTQTVVMPTAAPSSAGSELKNTQSFFFALDEGQAEKAQSNREVAHVWQQDMLFHFTEDVTYLERLRLILSIECKMGFSFQPEEAFPQTLSSDFQFYPNDAELSYSFGNLDRPWLRLSAGYFPFKYNPDAKDLANISLEMQPIQRLS